MPVDTTTYKLTGKTRYGMRALMVGGIGILGCIAAYASDATQFFHSYLIAYLFWVSIGLGALFFVMLHHLVNAQWSIALRRLVEALMVSLPVMAIFFIPLGFGIHDLYQWSQPGAISGDPLMRMKATYLHTTFFVLRTVVYFVIWTLLAFGLHRLSVAEDAGYDEARRVRIRRICAGGMILFAFTTTFAAFDWIMSLDANWYSTIFGAYYYAGAVVGALSVIILLALYLRRQGILTDAYTVEHYNDLGKLLFAFMIFWAYMAFSQYFLIWYGNIPEETIWFQHRWVGSWKAVSLALVFGNFVIPFLFLMPKMIKRNYGFLAFISLWMLLFHWLDLFWLVMPGHSPNGAHVSWMDLVTMAGIGGIFIGLFWRRFAGHPLVPVGDPRLAKSIQSLSH